MIVALDIATQCGIAVGSPGGKPRAWSVDLGKGRSEDARFSKALVLTHELIARHKPELVAIEAPVGGPNTSHYLVGLIACVRGVCCNRGVPVETFAISAIRRHFIGRNLLVKDFPALKPAAAKLAIKGEVMKRCRLLGWDVPDTDSADAAALFDFACATRGHQTTPAGGLFR